MMRRTSFLSLVGLAVLLLTACGRLDVSIVEPTLVPTAEPINVGPPASPDESEQAAVLTPPAPAAVTRPAGQEPVTPADGQATPNQQARAGDEADGENEPSGQGADDCLVRIDWPLYAVQSGDTLFRIARSVGATVDQLVEANCLADPDRLYSGQRLRLPQLPTEPYSSATPTATPRPEPWARFDDSLYQVSFEYPAAWRDVSDDLMTRLAGEDGWLQLSAAGAPGDLDTVAGDQAQHRLLPYGSSPVVEPLTLSDGRPARLILPSADQPATMNGQALIVAPYADPVLIGSYPHNYLMLVADGDHIRDIGATLRLPPPANDLFIESFTVSGEDLPDGGKRLTFRWSARGANRGFISSGTAQRFAPRWPVESAGQLIVDVPGTLFPDPLMTLRMVNDVSGQEATATAVLSWACQHDYFFQPGPERCPRAAALVVGGAFQPFERGFMIWLPRPDLAQPSIFVFTEDGRVSLYSDTWSAGDPGNTLDEAPPAGLFEPVGGFAKVWREHPQVRAELGWATAAEWLYSVSYQSEARESLPGVAYLTRPDGSLLRLLDTVWQAYVPGQEWPGPGGGPTP